MNQEYILLIIRKGVKILQVNVTSSSTLLYLIVVNQSPPLWMCGDIQEASFARIRPIYHSTMPFISTRHARFCKRPVDGELIILASRSKSEEFGVSFFQCCVQMINAPARKQPYPPENKSKRENRPVLQQNGQTQNIQRFSSRQFVVIVFHRRRGCRCML